MINAAEAIVKTTTQRIFQQIEKFPFLIDLDIHKLDKVQIPLLERKDILLIKAIIESIKSLSSRKFFPEIALNLSQEKLKLESKLEDLRSIWLKKLLCPELTNEDYLNEVKLPYQELLKLNELMYIIANYRN